MKVLYISSGVGLGHATRDYRLSLELKRRGHSVTWLSSGLALEYLKAKNETLHSVSYELKSMGDSFEKLFKGGKLAPGFKNLHDLYRTYSFNKGKISQIKMDDYDIIISDEGWEALDRARGAFFITDFEKFSGRFGTLGNYLVNKLNEWYQGSLNKNAVNYYVGLRPATQGNFKHFGQIYTHSGNYPEAKDKNYILITLGGTQVGKIVTQKVVSKKLPLIAQNPNNDRDRFDPLPSMANSSVIICMAGYGTLLEVAAMRKRAIINVPFNDFEQESNSEIFQGRKGYRVIYMNQDVNFESLINDVMQEEPDPPAFKDAAVDIVNDIEISLTAQNKS